MSTRLPICALMTSCVALAGFSLGCDRRSPSPTQPSPLAVAVPEPPAPVPSGPLSVTAIAPDVGSTDGTYFTITGAGFVGPTVKVGGILMTQTYSPDSATIGVSTPAHAAGTFDVIVTNRNGQSATVTGGFTYAPPDSFQVDGNWEGGADSNYETPLRFTIQNGTLTSVSCGTSATVTFSSPVPIIQGKFSVVGDDGTRMSGRFLSAYHAMGAISISSCINYPWWTTRQ